MCLRHFIGRMLETIPPGELSKAHVQMSGLGWDHFKILLYLLPMSLH